MKLLIITFLLVLPVLSNAKEIRSFTLLFNKCQLIANPLFNAEGLEDMQKYEGEAIGMVCIQNRNKSVICDYYNSKGKAYNSERFNIVIENGSFMQWQALNGATRVDINQPGNKTVLTSVDYIERNGGGLISVANTCSGIFMTKDEADAFFKNLDESKSI